MKRRGEGEESFISQISLALNPFKNLIGWKIMKIVGIMVKHILMTPNVLLVAVYNIEIIQICKRHIAGRLIISFGQPNY